MIEYTHRDRRAQRDVSRAFLTVVGLVVALIGFALAVPLEFSGVVAVVALGILGVAYIGWSDRLVHGYTRDLRSEREGESSKGVLRAELRSSVGLDRDVGRPTERSPHVRRTSPTTSGSDEGPLPSPESEPDQL